MRTESMKTIQVDDEILDDLILIIDDRVNFIKSHIHHNPEYLGKQRDRLELFFMEIDKLRSE